MNDSILITDEIFDVAKIAEGFKLPQDTIIARYRDGRAFSPIAEEKSAIIFGFTKSKSTNSRGFDLLAAGLKVEVKCLAKTEMVYFRESGNTGKGRTCNASDVKRFTNRLAAVVIVDITDFPNVKYISIPSSIIAGWLNDGIINKNNGGLPKNRFYEAIDNS